MRRPFFSTAIVVVLIAMMGLAATGLWLRTELETGFYGSSQTETLVEIPRRASTSRVADLLVDSGVLRRKIPFLLYMRLTNKGRSIQAGEYKFAGAVSPLQVARRLITGDVYFKSVTIPEGLTAQETIELLARNGVGSLSELQDLLYRTDLISDLNPDARNLEGYLFPETYRFGSRADSEAVVRAMVEQFRTRITRLTAQNPPSRGWDIPRIITLASMIEKEVKKAEEAPLVASVYVNRLDRGMPLACDATIIYAMKLAGIYRGRLGRADLVMASPYNSYLHTNLPPGPIANPGENSIRAALKPAVTDYYYYVSRNDGTHQFSKNFTHHQIAVDRFQKSLR